MNTNKIQPVKQGMRIPYMKPGYVMGPTTGNMLIAVANAFLNLSVVAGTKNDVLISELNSILSLDIANLAAAGGSENERMNFPDSGTSSSVAPYEFMKGYEDTWVSGKLYRKNDIVHKMESTGIIHHTDDSLSGGDNFGTFGWGDHVAVWNYFFIWTGEASSSTPEPDIRTINIGHLNNYTGNDTDNKWVLLCKYCDYFLDATGTPSDDYPTKRQEPYTGFVYVQTTPGGPHNTFRCVGGILYEVTPPELTP